MNRSEYIAHCKALTWGASVIVVSSGQTGTIVQDHGLAGRMVRTTDGRTFLVEVENLELNDTKGA